MTWNEPGGSNRDPWGGGGRDQGPPDLDEIVRKKGWIDLIYLYDGQERRRHNG